jgi:hypothetical protein
VPLSASPAPVLAVHIRQYPPAEVTLPWQVPGGPPVTHALLLTRPGALVMHRTRANEDWQAALVRAGILQAFEMRGGRKRGRGVGMHVLWHTAPSARLAAGVDVVSVAAWLGDTAQTVTTYAHLMPDADDRGRAAMDQFLSGSARDVQSDAVR